MHRTPVETTENRRTERALERLADSLLSRSLREKGDGGYPFYSLRWERRTATRDESLREAHELERPQSRRELHDLVRTLSRRLRLPMHMRAMLTWLAEGYSRREVETMLGAEPQAVDELLRRLRRAARRARLSPGDCGQSTGDCQTPTVEVEQVFREQCERADYHDERHCPAGKELCRRTGKCARRWYLRFAER